MPRGVVVLVHCVIGCSRDKTPRILSIAVLPFSQDITAGVAEPYDSPFLVWLIRMTAALPKTIWTRIT